MRKHLLQVAIDEKTRELTKLKSEFESKCKIYNDINKKYSVTFYSNLQKQSALITKRINTRMNKKLSFHQRREVGVNKEFTSKRIFRTKKKHSKRRKVLNRQNYKRNKKVKIRIKIENLVEKIKKENIVINLSSVEVPSSTTIYLAKGLGFVKSCKVDIQDLKYDTLEFLRKVEWKAFFKDNPGLTSHLTNIHEDLKISGGKSPNFQHPLLQEIKTKMLGWISNHKVKTPLSNLTQLELRGKKWILNKIKEKELFITKADKGGATLIMNYNDVVNTIEKELFNIDNFEIVSNNAEKHLAETQTKVISMVKSLANKNILTSEDKSLIAGLNANNKLKLEPEYRAETPYAYPLFKIHKLSAKQISEKKIPPNRLVHAAKFGPLYRIEKWSSPYLTKISQMYCHNEFLLDTNDLLKQVNDTNNSNVLKEVNINLFTLDVEKLYPSIQPQMALLAIKDVMLSDTATDKRIKSALESFIKFGFDESYITYKNSCFKNKKGIPTGGCISRQIADVFLHWVLFFKSDLKIDDVNEIRFWKRFIDDCLGIWRGTKRQFLVFVKSLNVQTNKFGLNFPLDEVQFGKSVNFLDVTLYLDEQNNIQYKSYTKPTDAKRFLNPTSFHPHHIFKSVPFSQMIRTINRNSEQNILNDELEKLNENLIKSGYKVNKLMEIETEILQKRNNLIDNVSIRDSQNKDILTFPLFYFDGIKEFKTLVYDMKDDFKALIGNVEIMFATKKGKSIGNTVIKNKNLGIIQNDNVIDQKCNANVCLQCPLVNTKDSVIVNNKKIIIPNYLNCKTQNAIYLWTCKLCENENNYFGRTIQECHKRTNGHRVCFHNGDFQKSALSMHSQELHPDNSNLENFEIAVIKRVNVRNIKREEFRVIDKFRTNTLGLNRYKAMN